VGRRFPETHLVCSFLNAPALPSYQPPFMKMEDRSLPARDGALPRAGAPGSLGASLLGGLGRGWALFSTTEVEQGFLSSLSSTCLLDER
jgi:hypothetical protein